MGKRGPKPKPTALRILEGNPANRPLNEFEPSTTMPAIKPSIVSVDLHASLEWDRLLAAMPPGIYTALDVAALTQYALAWSMLVRSQASLDSDGLLMDVFESYRNGATGELKQVKTGTQINPAARTWKAAQETLTKMTDRLGLTPGVRSKLQLPSKPAESKSGFAGLLGATKS